MQHVDQWYRYLTEAEKTATMYTLLQHSTQVQARFFINLLQQMVKRDPLFSLLTPNNPDQGNVCCEVTKNLFTHLPHAIFDIDMQNHLAGAMAKAELEASQRLMSVLPYKTGQVISRPQSSTTNRRTVDRHSFALGDTEEYSRLFSSAGGGRSSDLLNHSRSSSPYVNSLLDDTNGSSNTNNNNISTTSSNGRRLVNGRSGTSGRTMFNNGGRPHSVIEGDTTSLFPISSSSASWLNNNATRRAAPPAVAVGHIGDRSKMISDRPKSADISNWSLPTEPMDRRSASNNTNGGFHSVWSTQQRPIIPELVDNDLVDFTNSLGQQQQPFRRRANVNRIPVVPESDELVRATHDLFLNDLNVDTSRSNSPYRKPQQQQQLQPTAPPGIEHYSNYLLTPQSQSQQSLHNSTPLTSQSIVDNSILSSANNNLILDEHEYASDHSDGSFKSRRRSSSMAPNNNTRPSKDKKAIEVIDMELLKGNTARYTHCITTMILMNPYRYTCMAQESSFT
jgi:hypothetical protein